MKVLVCGGRDYKDGTALFKYLDSLHQERTITVLITGGASGADTLAVIWAGSKEEIKIKTYFAHWRVDGRAAGFIRNQRMLDQGEPDLVVAFPGGSGTNHMIFLAKQAKLEILRP